MCPSNTPQAEPADLDWSQAPEDATHAYQPPGWPMCWLKLGEPAEQELWRRPGAKNWRQGVSGCGKWLRHPHVTARPAGQSLRTA